MGLVHRRKCRKVASSLMGERTRKYQPPTCNRWCSAAWPPASTGSNGRGRIGPGTRAISRPHEERSKTPHTMHRCRRVQDHTVPARRSDLSEGSRAAGLALTIQIVALQQRRHETSRDRIHEAEVRTMEGASPVRLLATG